MDDSKCCGEDTTGCTCRDGCVCACEFCACEEWGDPDVTFPDDPAPTGGLDTWDF